MCAIWCRWRCSLQQIVESICAGRQGVCLSAERLKTQTGLPIEWDVQQRLLAD
jgi:hypothetical protein